MGYGQLGVTGHPIIKTPNIDKLANEGILFTQAYSGSTVCSPSRISLMTGKDTGALHSNANTMDYIDSYEDKNPFFMFLSYTSPHAELAAPKEFVAPYSGKFDETFYTGMSDPENKPMFAEYYP